MTLTTETGNKHLVLGTTTPQQTFGKFNAVSIGAAAGTWLSERSGSSKLTVGMLVRALRASSERGGGGRR